MAKETEMTEEILEKDNFILIVAIIATIAISVLLALKNTESDKFAPIKKLLSEERNLMDIRVIKQDYE